MAQTKCFLDECENKCNKPDKKTPLLYAPPHFSAVETNWEAQGRDRYGATVYFCSAEHLFHYLYRIGKISDQDYYRGRNLPEREAPPKFELDLEEAV